jgi:diacylglycerol O-acyltransferase / wax synthase
VVSNMPGPQVPPYMLGGEVESMYPLIHGSGLNITAMSPRGKLDIGLVAYPDVLPDLWEMADEFAVAMEDLLALAR